MAITILNIITLITVIGIGVMAIKIEAEIVNQNDEITNKLNLIQHDIELAKMKREFHRETKKILRKSFKGGKKRWICG